jgi:hypothetical protein
MKTKLYEKKAQAKFDKQSNFTEEKSEGERAFKSDMKASMNPKKGKP